MAQQTQPLEAGLLNRLMAGMAAQADDQQAGRQAGFQHARQGRFLPDRPQTRQAVPWWNGFYEGQDNWRKQNPDHPAEPLLSRWQTGAACPAPVPELLQALNTARRPVLCPACRLVAGIQQAQEQKQQAGGR